MKPAKSLDAGKTSLTERLLHYTDSMSLDRQRGITIKSAVVSFAIDDVVVNLMRTLRRLRIPMLIFVNKIDRVGAQCERLLANIAEKRTRRSFRWA